MTLSPSMAPLGRYPRWINWSLEADPHRPEKPRKVPRNPRTGYGCKPQDPAAWCTYEEALAAAQARGHGLGFVFQEGDGLFFLDLDNCVDPATGTWNALAQHLMTVWGGHAAIEVSQSGKGLHIFGWASTIPEHGCRNIALGLELYHHDRFVAFTDYQSTGSLGTADLSLQLKGVVDAYFPKTATSRDVVDWCDEGDGATADDRDLLQIMMHSKSNASTFGDKATFAELFTGNEDALGKAFPTQNGHDAFDRSAADSALASLLIYWTGGNMERTERFMRQSALAREKWDDRPDYLETTIIKAAGIVKNRATLRVGGGRASEEERRQRQRAITRVIGEGSNTIPATQLYTLEEMLERFVYITEGAQVADRLRPQVVLPFADFKGATAASTHTVTKPDGATREVPCATLWHKSPDRKDAETLTFRAGAPVMTVSPSHGKTALNLWAPPVRRDPPADWENRAAVFVEHIQWLWDEHAEAFLDWLGHIEQKPGELPHFGWVHISRTHGKGRNWISAVLARLWRGNVAASFDLVGALEGSFNDRLSRCLLAIVDEINEGGQGSWRHAQALRQMVTAEHREINPKYGRRHVEYNATRWLMFSNHTAAIPLGVEDRRFWVVDHDGPVKPPSYYAQLYFVLDDPLFVASVAHLLASRDISRFEPGQRPPHTKAKAALVQLSQSDIDIVLAEVVNSWPAEVVSWTELQTVLPDGRTPYSVLKHPMDRVGMRRVNRKVRTSVRPEPVYSLRNHDRWTDAAPSMINAELSRLPLDTKLALLCGNDEVATGA